MYQVVTLCANCKRKIVVDASWEDRNKNFYCCICADSDPICDSCKTSAITDLAKINVDTIEADKVRAMSEAEYLDQFKKKDRPVNKHRKIRNLYHEISGYIEHGECFHDEEVLLDLIKNLDELKRTATEYYNEKYSRSE